MYLYIYDSCLKEKKYQKILIKIESRIIDLDIKGKILRLNMLKNINEIVREEVEKGAHTIVVVGNDKTFNSVIESAIKNDVLIGYIPIEKSAFAEIFGIPIGELSCNILSGRIIKKIDIGKINQKFFINSIIIENAQDIELKIEDFKIKTENHNKIIIKNLDIEKQETNPTDGILELFIEKPGNFFNKNNTHSLFTTKKVVINSLSEPRTIIFDEFQSLNTPATVNIATEKLNVIVGSERKF
ncbi:hypothetical protein K8R66_02775 [bacterium]|nr:hypothetical protein [bacterium]